MHGTLDGTVLFGVFLGFDGRSLSHTWPCYPCSARRSDDVRSPWPHPCVVPQERQFNKLKQDLKHLKKSPGIVRSLRRHL